MRIALCLLAFLLAAGCQAWDLDGGRSKRECSHKQKKEKKESCKKKKKKSKKGGDRGNLDDRLASIERRLLELEAASGKADSVKDTGRPDGGVPRVGPAGVAPLPSGPMPEISGAIVGVSDRLDLVVINRGEDDGVRIGFLFTVYRGSGYVARMAVEKVYPNQAVGRIVPGSGRDEPKPGDQATTIPFISTR